VVVVDGALLGKPSRCGGCGAHVANAFGAHASRDYGSVLGGGRRGAVSSETTVVTVNRLTDQDIADYVASGEPMDKAGAYAIQAIASRWIPRIDGELWQCGRAAGGVGVEDDAGSQYSVSSTL